MKKSGLNKLLGFKITVWNNNKNNEAFWAVLSSLERYKFPERKDENEFGGKAGGANQKEQELWSDYSGISAT